MASPRAGTGPGSPVASSATTSPRRPSARSCWTTTRRGLSLISCPRAQDIPAGGIETLCLSGLDWKDLSRLAGHTSLRELDIRGLSELRDLGALTGLSELTEINLGHCRDLEDCRPLLDMPSLKHVTMPYRMWYSEYHGDPDPVMTELAERGVTVVHP